MQEPRCKIKSVPMFMKSLVAAVVLAALPVLLPGSDAAAQVQHRTRHSHGGTAIVAQQTPPPRIEINPRRLLYRRCKDWYVIQYRPSGRVLFPQTHCWWVRG
jgi:hypothetical protein